MATYDTILQKIYNWDLEGAEQDLEQALDLDIEKAEELQEILNKYKYADSALQELEKQINLNPPAVLRELSEFPEELKSHPKYAILRSKALERIKAQTRQEVMSSLEDARSLAEDIQLWGEAKQRLEAVKTSDPDWGSDSEIKERIRKVEDEVNKGEETERLLSDIAQAIKTGKPDEGLMALNKADLIGKLSKEESDKLRAELERLAQHKIGKSSKDDRELIDDTDIEATERAVASIKASARESGRLLYNNQIHLESLYRNAIENLRKTVAADQKKDEKYKEDLANAISDTQKISITRLIQEIEAELEALRNRIESNENKLRELVAEVEETYKRAVQQVHDTVDIFLEDAKGQLKAGALSLAMSAIQGAMNAGKAEIELHQGEDKPRVEDKLANIQLTADQEKRLADLEALIKTKQEQRNESLKIIKIAQISLKGNPSLKELNDAQSEFQRAKDFDENAPGLGFFLKEIGVRLENEKKYLRSWYTYEINILCTIGWVDQAKNRFEESVRILGEDDALKDCRRAIQANQSKVTELRKIEHEFEELFRQTREAMEPAPQRLGKLIEEWNEKCFEVDIPRVVRAKTQLEQYQQLIGDLGGRIHHIEKSLSKIDKSVHEDIEVLKASPYHNTRQVLYWLARYYQAMAEQHGEHGQNVEYLQWALEDAEKAHNNELMSQISVRLQEIRSQTQQGRQARIIEDDLKRYEQDLPRALSIIQAIPENVREDPRIRSLVKEIEYKDRQRKSIDLLNEANKNYENGEFDLAIERLEESLSACYSPQAFKTKLNYEASQRRETESISQIQKALALHPETEKNSRKAK